MTAPTLPGAWELVARAQAGDETAVADLYRQYQQTLLRFVYGRTRHVQTAEDLTSEVWVRALRRLPSVEDRGVDFGAWLITIARNLVVDFFKSAKFRLEVTTGDVLDLDGTAADDPAGMAVDSVQRSAAARLLDDAMRKLTAGQQQVIRLRFYEGLNTIEAAEVMGLEVGASKVLQHRACASLRRQLAEVSA